MYEAEIFRDYAKIFYGVRDVPVDSVSTILYLHEILKA
jgi:hypothetical protein